MKSKEMKHIKAKLKRTAVLAKDTNAPMIAICKDIHENMVIVKSEGMTKLVSMSLVCDLVDSVSRDYNISVEDIVSLITCVCEGNKKKVW